MPVAVALAAVIGFLVAAPGSSPGHPAALETSAAAHASASLRASATLRASTKPKPAPKPPPVGDACLVGAWQDQGYRTTTKWAGTTVAVTGGSGNIDHISAAGTDTDVYGPNTLPFYGTYSGSTLEETLQGEEIFSLHASPSAHRATKIDHGWTSGSTNKYEYQGSSNTGYFNAPDTTPTTYSYSCNATTLTWAYKGKVDDVETRLSTTP